MKISQYGYHEREVKAYCLTMGEIKDSILQAMIRNDAKDNLVRLVNATAGEVLEYKGMEALIMADLNNRYEVHVTRAAQIHLNDINQDAIVVVFEDDLDDEI